MAVELLKKVSILTTLVVITTILNYNNLSRQSHVYLREVGPSKMSDRELFSGLEEEEEAENEIEAAGIAISEVDSLQKRRETPENTSLSSQSNPLSFTKRQLKMAAADDGEHGVGYVLADDYWEQQNSGCRNLQSLQCWAAKLNLRVVEPFIVNSVLRTLPSSENSGWLRYRDMFDVDEWNRESRGLNNSELVSWEEFTTKAHRSVITVEFKYAYSKDVQKTQTQLKANPSQKIDINCEPKTGWPKSNQMSFLGSYNFSIVRKVCLNFEYGKYLTLTEFRDAVLGNYSQEKVTIIFKQWRGLGRILVKDSGCGNTGIQENMQPSKRLYNDGSKYVSTYLASDSSKYSLRPTFSSSESSVSRHGYIAVMARLEKSKLSFHKRKGIVPYCFEQTLNYTRRLVEDSGIDRVFLSIDIGRFGSNSFRNTGDSSDLQEEFQKFFKNFYRGQVTIAEWEQTFQDVSHMNDSGYIALLQKIVVTQAKCVIFVGGGAFQKHALNLYRSSHPKEEWCIHIVQECTVDKNLPMEDE